MKLSFLLSKYFEYRVIKRFYNLILIYDYILVNAILVFNVNSNLLVEGATLYTSEDYGTEKDFEVSIRQPQKTLIYTDILSGVQFYSEKNIDSEKIENIGRNLYRYIVDDTFTYTIEELEKKK